MEDLYAAVIRPEDGETWGRIPWMDDAWIEKNSVEMTPAELEILAS
jgi:hypothetical protein